MDSFFVAWGLFWSKVPKIFNYVAKDSSGIELDGDNFSCYFYDNKPELADDGFWVTNFNGIDLGPYNRQDDVLKMIGNIEPISKEALELYEWCMSEIDTKTCFSRFDFSIKTVFNLFDSVGTEFSPKLAIQVRDVDSVFNSMPVYDTDLIEVGSFTNRCLNRIRNCEFGIDESKLDLILLIRHLFYPWLCFNVMNNIRGEQVVTFRSFVESRGGFYEG